MSDTADTLYGGQSNLPPCVPFKSKQAHPNFAPRRMELLECVGTPANPFLMARTGRLGWVLNVLQDGDADIELDDGKPPFLVKWRQVFYLEPR